MTEFIWGATAMACAACGLFFLRFWQQARERLFIFFAIAFWALAVNWTVLAIAQPPNEARHLVYAVRVVAFTMLILAIIDKNRRS